MGLCGVYLLGVSRRGRPRIEVFSWVGPDREDPSARSRSRRAPAD